jgi:hypothetical protein
MQVATAGAMMTDTDVPPPPADVAPPGGGEDDDPDKWGEWKGRLAKN